MAAGDQRMGDVERGRMLTILVDGRIVIAYEGETIAAALLGSGRSAMRRAPRTGEARGYFCGMGICHDCLVTVDDRSSVRACVTPVREGMRLSLRDGIGEG